MEFKIANPVANAAILLRFGLAVVFLYAAIASLMNPQDWVGYLPDFVIDRFDGELLLKFFSVFEIALGLWLLSGKHVFYASLVCAASLTGIVVSSPSLFIITFRDVGLVFAALALTCLSLPEKYQSK